MLTQGSETSLEVEGQPNIVSELDTYVENNTLMVKFKSKNINMSYKKLIVHVSTPNIESLNLHGSGDVTALTDLNSNQLNISISGSGDVRLKSVTCKNMDVHVQGSGDVTVSGGTTDSITMNVNGSGDIEAYELNAKSVIAHTNGSGDIKCRALDAIDASVNGSGDIHYKGRPANTKVHTNGSGSISSN